MMTLSMMVEWCYAVSFMLSVVMLNVVMLNVVGLSVMASSP
jgi:hypothetical protein